MENKIKQYFTKNYNKYYKLACEEVGDYIADYERHPDTGEILADNGYYTNEEEIREKTREMFAEYFFDNCLFNEIFENQDIYNCLTN